MRIIEHIKNFWFSKIISPIKGITFKKAVNQIPERNIDFVALLLYVTFYLPKVDELQFVSKLKNNSISAWIITIIALIVLAVYIKFSYKRISGFLKSNYYLLTAYLMFLSFPVYDIWIFKAFPFIAWIAFVPLFIFLRGKSIREVYWYSFITGFLGNYMVYEWIGNFAGTKAGGYSIIVFSLVFFLTVFFWIAICYCFCYIKEI